MESPARNLAVLFAVLGSTTLAVAQPVRPGPPPAQKKTVYRPIDASFGKRTGVPVQVKHSLGGAAFASTWDGRVFIVRDYVPGGAYHYGWVGRVFRPEHPKFTTDQTGAPVFAPETASRNYPIEPENLKPGELVGHNNMTLMNALAITPAPGYEQNPFPSNRNGHRLYDVTAPGVKPPYHTYETVVYSQLWHLKAIADGERKLAAGLPLAPIDDFELANTASLGKRRVRIVVARPHTPSASVYRVDLLEPLQLLHDTDGNEINGIEPTLTFDGRLLVFQENGKLMYTWTRTPGKADGWRVPRTIAHLHKDAGKVLDDGISIGQRWPLARKPLRAADGTAFKSSDPFVGAYPWINLDGSELVHTSLIAGSAERAGERAMRGGLSVIGRFTGWTRKHIDGPLNPDRHASGTEVTVRLIFASPGQPGMWKPYRGVDVPIPYTADRPVLPLLGGNFSEYGEVSFLDHEDGDYVLYLHMNEMVTKDGKVAGGANPTHTPDTSGNFNTGILHRAQFPQEYAGDQKDHNVGISGQALYMTDDAGVRVPNKPSLSPRDGLTVQAFIKRLRDLGGDSANRYLVLLNKGRSYNLILEENGDLHATVWVNGKQRRLGFLGTRVRLNRWAHVAFTYDGASGLMRVYVDGRKVGERRFGAGRIDASPHPLYVGPTGHRPKAPGHGAVLIMDEVAVSRVARRPDELARDAFQPLPATRRGKLGVALPQGLDAADLRVPAEHTPAAAALGKQLFFDARLSGNGKISCATCHVPERGFADGLPTSKGISGRPLSRNTPTAINRAFGDAQFLDGRAASLEEQALGPIENPDEMGSSVPRAVKTLSSIPGYRREFQRVFKSGPSRSTIGRALAAYQRTLLSGGSPADRFEAGEPYALTASQRHGRQLFMGKARCISCHDGSNFSRETLHDTGVSRRRYDLGRGKVTGRARDLRRFKTPTLRDINETGPYFHDGSAATLEDVVEFYDRGGSHARGVAPRSGIDPEMFPLGLSEDDKADLINYLRSLTGTTLDRSRPRLPSGPREAAPDRGSEKAN